MYKSSTHQEIKQSCVQVFWVLFFFHGLLLYLELRFFAWVIYINTFRSPLVLSTLELSIASSVKEKVNLATSSACAS